MFGLSLWKLAAIGIAAAAILGAAWAALDRAHDRGFAEAKAQCDSENLAAKVETLQRLADSRERVIAAALAADAEREAALRALQERNDAFMVEFDEAERRADLDEREAIAKGAQVVTRCKPDAAAAERVRRSWGQ